MAKSVINLVKELGVKSTSEVLELLREVGYDTGVEGFGVMTKIEEDVVSRMRQAKGRKGLADDSALREVASPAEEPEKEKKAPRRIVSDDSKVDLDGGPIKRSARKDFFGARKPEKREPSVAAKEDPGEDRPRRSVTRSPITEKERLQQQGGPRQGGADAAGADSRPADRRKPVRSDKPDFSGGPRIISMPDPEDRSDASRSGSGGGLKRKPADPRRKSTATPVAAAAQHGGRRKKLKNIGGQDDDGRMRSRKRVFKVASQAQEASTVVPHLKIPGEMTIRDVAKMTGVKVAEIVRFLMRELEIMANINYVASVDEIQLIADHFEIDYTVDLATEPEGELKQFEDIGSDNLQYRPPVVTVMGHVDHGKTKLLDAIRSANVVAGEAGGITQHIGAYQVEKKGKHITFIDTPGHEAFTAMRARGSRITDIVILVVASDDGVMPQTIEAINHAKDAEVPIIVAVNKMDKPEANPERVRNMLAEHGLVPEEWGGDVMFAHISALTGDGIDDLLDKILLQTELVNPQADPSAPPFGVVIESEVDTGIGVVATVLVQQGQMGKGQYLLSGSSIGRIKRMEDDHGREVESAGPSFPVRVLGFVDPPENGDKVYTFKNKKQASAIAEQRLTEIRKKAAVSKQRMSLESFYGQMQEGAIKTLKLIIKADVQGSAEALVDVIGKLDVEGAEIQVISSGVGQVNESDVNFAQASGAVIIAFSTGVTSNAKRLMEKEKVDVRSYDIIYKVTEDLELAMKGMLDPEFEERQVGKLEIRAIFKTAKSQTVCGGYVLDGVAKRGDKYRLLRGGEVILENMTLHSLRRFKDDVREVKSGFECGFMVENTDVKEGDILSLYEMVEISRF
ncbi:MAG: translation initiation factor IF-2 [Planctomycetales bacterium]|nr:translation initiation factor IF-2 [bacterium]UNM08376.1 MAG: translation initiation factor IF-2 [Planctomycetales bacterium]